MNENLTSLVTSLFNNRFCITFKLNNCFKNVYLNIQILRNNAATNFLSHEKFYAIFVQSITVCNNKNVIKIG